MAATRLREGAVVVELSLSDADEIIIALQIGKPNERRRKLIDKIKMATASTRRTVHR
jgi:hypothetical protein